MGVVKQKKSLCKVLQVFKVQAQLRALWNGMYLYCISC